MLLKHHANIVIDLDVFVTLVVVILRVIKSRILAIHSNIDLYVVGMVLETHLS